MSTRIWQADVFRRHIHRQRVRQASPAVSVESVAGWLVQRYAIAATESTFVRVPVWDFLSALERVGFLRRRVRQKFEIIRDVLGNETEVPRPPVKAKALASATRGYCWARGGADVSQFCSAVCKTGVHVSPAEETLLLIAWQAPRLGMSNVETYPQTVAARLSIAAERLLSFWRRLASSSAVSSDASQNLT